MFGLLLIIAFIAWAILYKPSIDEVRDLPLKLSEKLDQLWVIAQDSLRENKHLRAEKALLTILRVDEKNATAYNRLGILYAKQQSYNDAIECFEIAQSLEPSASSLHNVGLIYYETGNYEKASLAFEQALEVDDELAARHIAYAKVQEKLGHNKKRVESLERAVELESAPHVLKALAEAYESTDQAELALDLRNKIDSMIAPSKPAHKKERQRPSKKTKRPKRLVM